MGAATTGARPGQIFNNQTDAPSGDPMAEVGQTEVGQPGYGPAPYLPPFVEKGFRGEPPPPPPTGMLFPGGKGGGKGTPAEQVGGIIVDNTMDLVGDMLTQQGESLPGPDVPADQVLPPEVVEPANPEFVGGLRPAPRNFRLPRSSRREALRRQTAGY